MAKFRIIQQECFGAEHWRTMREDGNRLVGGYHSVDLPSLEDAESFIERVIARENLGPSEVSVKRLLSNACDIRTVGAEVASV